MHCHRESQFHLLGRGAAFLAPRSPTGDGSARQPFQAGDELRRADRPADPSGRLRSQNQVDVVEHKTISPDLDLRLTGLLGQQIAVDFMIAALEEDRLPPIAALRHVMREAGKDHSGETGHEVNVPGT